MTTQPNSKAHRPGTGPETRKRVKTTAQEIIAALTLPGLSAAETPRSLPLPSLHRLPRDASMVYDVGSVDASGRVASQPVIATAGWQPGDRLDLIPATGAIVFRASPDGLWSVPPKGGVCLPAQARHRYRVTPGDRVLLAAARGHSLVIVYPASAIDEMITSYHAARTGGEGDHE
jgi:hypothetical protein